MRSVTILLFIHIGTSRQLHRLRYQIEAYKSAPVEAAWRSGYAEDCKSLHPSSILGAASIV